MFIKFARAAATPATSTAADFYIRIFYEIDQSSCKNSSIDISTVAAGVTAAGDTTASVKAVAGSLVTTVNYDHKIFTKKTRAEVLVMKCKRKLFEHEMYKFEGETKFYVFSKIQGVT
jgi:hypothetical protein